MDIQTSCKSCAFAEYTDKTQIGCSLGMLEKFQKAGVEIVEAYDEEKEFFIIKGRLCNGCRPPEWVEKHQDKDLIALVKKEISLRLHVVIPVMETTYDHIYVSIDALKKQNKLPHKVTVALNQDGIVPSQIISHLRDSSFEWGVFTSLERDETGKRVKEGRLIDHIMEKATEPFFMVLTAGHILDTDVIEKLDQLLNEKLERFSLIEADDFYVVQTALHKHFMGNRDVVAGDASGEEMPLGDIREKIRWAARIENQPHMIRQYSEMVS